MRLAGSVPVRVPVPDVAVPPRRELSPGAGGQERRLPQVYRKPRGRPTRCEAGNALVASVTRGYLPRHMSTVPFTVGDGMDDEVFVRGRLGVGSASVTLVLETGVDGSELEAPRKVVIGVEEFAACQFRRGILSDRLHLRTSSLSALGGVPGAMQDAMTLRFDKRDRNAAEKLAGRLAHRLQDNK
jgi:hypothetical protein